MNVVSCQSHLVPQMTLEHIINRNSVVAINSGSLKAETFSEVNLLNLVLKAKRTNPLKLKILTNESNVKFKDLNVLKINK